jgi:hypothetical protein
MTLASDLSLEISSSTEPTMTPPFLSDGISTFSTLSLGSISIPRSFKLIVSIGFFLALIILWILANRGVFRRRSQVKTAGRETRIFYNPKSTSLVTSADFPSAENSIFELNVAEGIPIKAAKI